MRYQYSSENHFKLENSLRKLESTRNMAQSQIYSITGMLNFDNIFKKSFRTITGYNNRLLSEYLHMLDNFVVKTSEAIQSKQLITDINSINVELVNTLLSTVDWVIYLYYDLLKDQKTYKDKRNHLLFFETFNEILDNLNQLLYNAITRVECDDKVLKEENKETEIICNQNKRGYINIDQYMIDAFN